MSQHLQEDLRLLQSLYLLGTHCHFKMKILLIFIFSVQNVTIYYIKQLVHKSMEVQSNFSKFQLFSFILNSMYFKMNQLHHIHKNNPNFQMSCLSNFTFKFCSLTADENLNVNFSKIPDIEEYQTLMKQSNLL